MTPSLPRCCCLLLLRTTPLSNFQKGRRNIGRNCRHLIKVLRQGENSSVTKTKTIIFQFISDDREREGQREREVDRAACMWSSLGWVSLSFYLSPGIALRPFLPLPSPPWHCQSVSGAFAVFHFAPCPFLVGKTICHLDNFLHVQSIARWSIFRFLASALQEGSAVQGEGEGESSPECRPCQVEYFSIVCRIHLAKFR